MLTLSYMAHCHLVFLRPEEFASEVTSLAWTTTEPENVYLIKCAQSYRVTGGGGCCFCLIAKGNSCDKYSFIRTVSSLFSLSFTYPPPPARITRSFVRGNNKQQVPSVIIIIERNQDQNSVNHQPQPPDNSATTSTFGISPRAPRSGRTEWITECFVFRCAVVVSVS